MTSRSRHPCHSLPTDRSKSKSLRRTPVAFALQACLLGANISSVAMAPAAWAQTEQTQRKPYRVAAGSLEDALNSFARQAGITLSFDPAVVVGKQSAGLDGDYSVSAGLATLLAPSGLAAMAGDNGAFTVVAGASSQSAAPVLPAVNVSAEAIAHDGAAQQGYRSSQVSQVGPWQGRQLEELPYSITVLSADLIKNTGGSSPDQLYRINPTTQLGRSQHENNQPRVYMRGFLNQNAYRDGLPGDQYGHDTTLEDTERLEVFTGLSGFLYGPGNVGGMINYVSKRPTAERLNRLTLSNNGGRNYHLHGDFGGPIDRAGRLGYRVNAAYQDGETAVDPTNIRIRFFSAAFDLHATDSLLLQFNVADREYDSVGAQTYWGLAPGVSRPSAASIDNTRSWSQPWSRRHYANTRYGVGLRWEPSTWLTVRAAWQANEGDRATGIPTNTFQSDGTHTQTVSNVVAPGVDPSSSFQEDKRAQLFADIRFDTGSTAHQLTAGVQYSDSFQERYLNNPPVLTTLTEQGLENGPIYIAPPVVEVIDRGARGAVSDQTYTTLTLGDDIQFNERWSMLIGASYSRIESPDITVIFPAEGYDDSAVTPTASLIFKPIPAVTTYATYMESLERGGVAVETFNGQPVANAGQSLDPMVSDQVEVGVKASLGETLVTAALFQIDKALQYYDLRNPEAPVFVQDGRQQHRGLEFTVMGRVGERWSLVGGLTMLDTTIREQKQNPALEGNRPMLVAEQLLKLRSEYDTPWLQGLTLIAGFSYTSDQYVDASNADRLPSFTLFDAGARYVSAIGDRPLTLHLELQNLGDKRYWANGAHIGDPLALTFGLSMDL